MWRTNGVRLGNIACFFCGDNTILYLRLFIVIENRKIKCAYKNGEFFLIYNKQLSNPVWVGKSSKFPKHIQLQPILDAITTNRLYIFEIYTDTSKIIDIYANDGVCLAIHPFEYRYICLFN